LAVCFAGEQDPSAFLAASFRVFFLVFSAPGCLFGLFSFVELGDGIGEPCGFEPALRAGGAADPLGIVLGGDLAHGAVGEGGVIVLFGVVAFFGLVVALFDQQPLISPCWTRVGNACG